MTGVQTCALPISRYAARRADVRSVQFAERHAQVRARAVEIYGGCCVQCGVTEGLELDHVDDDGKAHRERESHRALYARIASGGVRVTDVRLQLLCRPCHVHKHRGPDEVRERARRNLQAASTAMQWLKSRGLLLEELPGVAGG